MSNLILNKWGETAAEKQLRQKGYAKTQHGALEGGCQFPAYLLRKEHAGEALQQIARVLHAMRQKMADLAWDDEQTGVFIGVQIRNQWYEIDGELVEKGGPEWLALEAKKAMK
jgi:hypothetical protein